MELSFLPSVLSRLTVIATAVCIAFTHGDGGESMSAELTWEHIDSEVFWDLYGRMQPPPIEPGSIEELERAWEDAERRAGTAEIEERLRRARRQWQYLSEELDRELDLVERQADRDATIRSIATFFSLAATLADAAASIQVLLKDPVGKFSKPSDFGNQADAPDGSVRLEERVKRTIKINIDGEWKEIGVERILREVIVQPSGTDGRAVASPIGRRIVDSLNRAAERLPPIACNSEFEGCFSVSHGTGISGGSVESYADEVIIVSPPHREPTHTETMVFDLLKPMIRPGTSFGVDLLPIAGQVKSIVELLTGTDPITGDRVNRAFASIGLLPGVKAAGKSIKPIMKAAIKTLDKVPPKRARVYTRVALGSWVFRKHFAGKIEGDYPLAVIQREFADEIGARSRVVRFSKNTAEKQRMNHSDLVPNDYARVQRIFDEGKVFRRRNDDRHLVGFLTDESGRIWRAVVKRTKNSEIYLKTFHKAQPRDLTRAEARLKIIKHGTQSN